MLTLEKPKLYCIARNSEDIAYKPAKVYDLEHHYLAPEFFDCLAKRTDYPMLNEYGVVYGEQAFQVQFIPYPFWENALGSDVISDLGDIRLGIMNGAGIDTGVVSSSQGIEQLPKEDAVRLAQITNNHIAEAVKKHPGRFLGTITLPTPYVKESIAELERAVKELGLQYWHTNSNYGNEFLYEEKFEPLIAKCAELDVPIYLHPNYPPHDCDYLMNTGTAMSSAAFAFGADTMRTSMRLILNGVFDRYPNLILILGHLGEYYPYTLERIDNRIGAFTGGEGGDPTIKSKKTFKEYFKNKNIFITTCGITDPVAVSCAIDAIGIDHIMFGTDYPYEEIKAEVDFIKSLSISDEDKDKIFYKNAEKFIFKNCS